MSGIYRSAGSVYSFPFIVTNAMGQAADWQVAGTLVLRSDDIPQLTPPTAYEYRRDGEGRYTALVDSANADLLTVVDAGCFDDERVLTVDLVDWTSDGVDQLCALLPRAYIVGEPRPSLAEIAETVQEITGLSPGPGALRVKVVVRDAVTNARIPGARISAYLVGADSANLWGDALGEATLKLTPHNWAIIIYATGYTGFEIDPYPVLADNQLLEVFLNMSVVIPPEPNKATAWTILRKNGVALEGLKAVRQYVSSVPGSAGNSDTKVPEIMLSGDGGLVMFTNLLPGTKHAFWRENNEGEAVYVDVPVDVPPEGLTIQIPDMGG